MIDIILFIIFMLYLLFGGFVLGKNWEGKTTSYYENFPACKQARIDDEVTKKNKEIERIKSGK